MSKIIHLTEEQIRKINERTYIDGLDNNNIPEMPMSKVSADGKLDQDNYAIPDTGAPGRDMTPQRYWNGRMYPSQAHFNQGVMNETDDTVEVDNEVDPFYDKEEDKVDVLSNGNQNDDLAAVNNTVSTRLDALVSEIESANLTDKQRAMVANKVIESLKLGTMPSSWKKILMRKINIQ